MHLRSALLIALWFALRVVAPSALAQGPVPPPAPGKLLKVVILSRHGVRSPIPSQGDLDKWITGTEKKWPTWYCSDGGRVCDRGELTPRGMTLARQMGTYYGKYLAELLPINQCPAANDVFFWADLDPRTIGTGRELLAGFRPACDTLPYFHTAPTPPDRVFHPVTNVVKPGSCILKPARAEREILARAGGDLAKFITAKNLGPEIVSAQGSLKCCQQSLCTDLSKDCGEVKTCTLSGLPSCLERKPPERPTEVQLKGQLRIAETFGELLLLEYANGFAEKDVGWGIERDEMLKAFRLHTTAFDLVERAPYIASLQGSRLLRRILLALKGESDGKPETAPSNAKFVAYVGHDTNIANVAGMLGLTWNQQGYQTNQMPPAGALVFELHEDGVYVFYVAQSLDDMRNLKGEKPTQTPVAVPNCSSAGSPCPLARFEELVKGKLDRNCS